MRKLALVSASLALVGAQAAAEVRPQDCRPVFPVVDQVAAAIPPEIAPVAPVAEAVAVPERRYSALPFLLPLIGLVGIIVIVSSHHNHHHNTVSPA